MVTPMTRNNRNVNITILVAILALVAIGLWVIPVTLGSAPVILYSDGVAQECPSVVTTNVYGHIILFMTQLLSGF